MSRPRICAHGGSRSSCTASSTAFPYKPALRPMIAWRIVRDLYPVLDGRGAAEFGGRWNSPGRPMIYAGGSFAIAILERLVYLPTGRVPANQVWAPVDILDTLPVETVDPDDLPGWDAADQAASRRFGDAWHDARRTAVLLVPSAVTKIDRNVLVNPDHPDFPAISTSAPRRVHWDRDRDRRLDRKSHAEGKSVSVRVALGGRGSLEKKKTNK